MQIVEFFYDLRSPYTYFAWSRRDVLRKAGACLRYVPVSIDALLNFQAGRAAWAEYSDPLAPPKRQHLMYDIPRMARYWGITLGGPFTFKPQSKRAMCLATALQSADMDQEKFIDYALHALWHNARDLTQEAVFAELIAVANLSSFSENAALDDLTSNTSLAFQTGIFGVPSFRHNGQVYFGADRMEVLAFELRQNGPARRQ